MRFDLEQEETNTSTGLAYTMPCALLIMANGAVVLYSKEEIFNNYIELFLADGDDFLMEYLQNEWNSLW